MDLESYITSETGEISSSFVDLIKDVKILSSILTTEVAGKFLDQSRLIPCRDTAWKETFALLDELENSNEAFPDVSETIEKWRIEAKMQLHKLTGNQRVNLIKDAGKVKAQPVPKPKLVNSVQAVKKVLKQRSNKSTKTRQVHTPKGYEFSDDNNDTDVESTYSEDNDFSYKLATYVPKAFHTESEAQQALKRMCPRFIKIYRSLIKKFLLKTYRQRLQWRRDKIANAKRASKECMRVLRQKAIISQKLSKDFSSRGRNIFREISSNEAVLNKTSTHFPTTYVISTQTLDIPKKIKMIPGKSCFLFAKSVADELGTSASATAAAKKKADRQAAEQRKADMDLLENKRQQRKLDFLLTQTELYAHFMASKTKPDDSSQISTQNGVDQILKKLDDKSKDNSSVFTNAVDRLGLRESDIFDIEKVKTKALEKVQNAVSADKAKLKDFAPAEIKCKLEEDQQLFDEVKLPSLFQGELKHYQLNGLNWLLSLFNQGINGILADEMGLGKTIQTIAFLASLAENYNLWGPFLIITPASTLHNWTQEFARFTPDLKLIPYWGGPQERKILRRFWSNDPLRPLATREAEFHVVVTSYQVVLQDAKFINKTAWSYLVLDEAHAIKSISSLRWNILLSFKCRNRLLLTGTPIQNTMQELWALLHFIMPSLFDSHDEFSAWFSKDIESRAASEGTSGGTVHGSWSTSRLSEEQLGRLHLILKPFMLRRIKAQVQHEIAKKTELLVECNLTERQRHMYEALCRKLPLVELTQIGVVGSTRTSADSQLMNLVMQLRKICNHPDLIERREVSFSSYSFSLQPLEKYALTNRLSSAQYIHTSIFDYPISCGYHLREHFASRVPSLIYDYDLINDKKINRFRLNLFEKFFKSSLCLGTTDSYNSLARLSKLYTGINTNRFIHDLNYQWNPNFFSLNLPDNFGILSKYLDENFGQPLIFASKYCHYFTDWKVLHVKTRANRSESEFSILNCMPGIYPRFIYDAYLPKSIAKPIEIYASRSNFSCTRIFSIRHTGVLPNWRQPIYLVPRSKRWTDSGKLVALDQLLQKLKSEGHRVLIYSQMTKMIDILEEVLHQRNHKYLRLDGSSKLSDRRDMVNQWQTNSFWFIFLLSTRAGGLGINLTAADTVIFYDSDWNPTVDQQAMDRAHRLGQTKPVTVYRLICRGTIEKRMLQRAQTKRNMQHLVIKDGSEQSDSKTDTMVLNSTVADQPLSQSDLASILLLEDECTYSKSMKKASVF